MREKKPAKRIISLFMSLMMMVSLLLITPLSAGADTAETDTYAFTITSNYQELSGNALDLTASSAVTYGKLPPATYTAGNLFNFEYSYSKLAYDSEKYEISKAELTIGDKTYTYTYGDAKATGSVLMPYFGTSLITAGQAFYQYNFIDSTKLGMYGKVYANANFHITFAEKSGGGEEPDPEPEPPAAPLLKGIVSTTALPDSEGNTQFDFTEASDGSVCGEATIVMETTNANTSILPVVDGDTTGIKLAYSYTQNTGAAYSAANQSQTTTVSLGNVQNTDGTVNDITMTATLDSDGDGTVDISQDYVVHVQQMTRLSGLKLTNHSDGSALTYTPVFAAGTTEYKASTLDHAVDVTFTNSDAGQTVYVNGEKIEGSTYAWELSEGENTLVFKAVKGDAFQTEYTLKVANAKNFDLHVSTDPSDAVFTLYDVLGNRIWPDENGAYQIMTLTDYKYNVSKYGYVGQTGTLNLAEAQDQSFTLEKAPESSPLPQLSSDYPSFRASADNNSVVSSKTVNNRDAIEVKWEQQIGDYVSPTSGCIPIIVDDKAYVMSGTTLYMYSTETGEMLKSAEMADEPGFNLMPATYADGMIFLPLNGVIQCMNAETLESLWVYHDPKTNYSHSSPIRYDDGYIYVGFIGTTSTHANFVCLSVTDEDPSNPLEEKVPTWINDTMGGFKWNGAWTNDNYVFVTNFYGQYFYCLDKQTGETVQQVSVQGSQNSCSASSIVYYGGRLYFTTSSHLYSFNLTEDGKLDLENTIEPLALGAQCTGTPVIYNNRFYIGLSSGKTFGVESYAILVGDIDPDTGALSGAYAVPTDGYVQTSGLLSNGYEEETGYVYVYFAANSGQGNIYMIKDKAGMTEADPESGLFYHPAHPQYTLGSVVADSKGNMYFKNDSAWQWCLTWSDLYIDKAEAEGGNAVIDGGSLQSGENHTIQVDPGTESITFRVTPSAGAEVILDGAYTKEKEIHLTDGEAEFKVRLEKGDNTKIYTFRVVSGPVLSNLQFSTSNNKNIATFITPSPEFTPGVKTYTAGYSATASKAYLVPTAKNSTDTVTCTAISGVASKSEGDVITGTSHWSGWTYYLVGFDAAATSARVNFTVTSEDGGQSSEYEVILYRGDTFPVITVDDGVISERTADSAKLNATVNKDGEIYYLIRSAEEAAPTAEEILAGDHKFAVAAGPNTADLTGLAAGKQKLYMALKDAAGETSVVYQVEIPTSRKLGDLNGDGKVTNADVSQLLDKVTAGASVELETGDLNGDGKITNADVSRLLDLVTAGQI